MSRGKWVCVRSTSAARRHLQRPAPNGRGLQNTPLGSTHGRTTSGVACHHRLWAAHTFERRRAWHAIIAFGQYTRSNDVGRGMPPSPLGSTHVRATSGVACHHRLWAHTVERRLAWHAIFAFLQHTRSNDVGRGMPSSPFDSIDGRPSSGVACHHSPWTAQTVGRRRTCLHTTVGRGLPASVVACATFIEFQTKHADVHGVHKSKDFETTSMHNKHIHLLSIIYSQTFPPNVALSHHFRYFYGSYDIETSFVCANMHLIINLTC